MVGLTEISDNLKRKEEKPHRIEIWGGGGGLHSQLEAAENQA